MFYYVRKMAFFFKQNLCKIKPNKEKNLYNIITAKSIHILKQKKNKMTWCFVTICFNKKGDFCSIKLIFFNIISKLQSISRDLFYSAQKHNSNTLYFSLNQNHNPRYPIPFPL